MRKLFAIAILMSGFFSSFAIASQAFFESLDEQTEKMLDVKYDGVVIVAGSFRIKQGMVDELKAITPELLKMHKTDDSIVEFTMLQSLKDSQVYAFYARFGSIQGLKAHMKTMHSSELGKKLDTLWEKDSMRISLWRQVKN